MPPNCCVQVPLFETLDDLNNAPTTCRELFSNDWYKAHINGMQECMIGGWGSRLHTLTAMRLPSHITLHCEAALPLPALARPN